MEYRLNNYTPKHDYLLWVLALSLVCAGVWSHYNLLSLSLLGRVISLIVSFVLAGCILAITTIGLQLRQFWQKSVAEIKLVVWPTKKEIGSTTIQVLIMVGVMGLFLWIIDALLIRLMGLWI